MATTLSPAEERELEATAPDVLRAIEREEHAGEDQLYPKPELADLWIELEQLTTDWDGFHAQVEVNRTVRFLQDETPKKWRRHLEGDRRIRTRLAHNEILRVVASQTRNPYKVEIEPAGASAEDKRKASVQKRWANALFPALARSRRRKGMRREFVDAQNSDGLAAWEFYLTGTYDRVDTSYREVEETGADGLPRIRRETPREFMKRTDAELIKAGLPFGLRRIDCLALVYEEDDEGVCKAFIRERKPYRHVYASLVRRLGRDKVEDLQMPGPGTGGWPWRSTHNESARGEVECVRYYDRVWYAYIVGGKLIELHRHRFPGVPVFPCPGIVTSSPAPSEKFQGITWGMLDMETALNDLLTLAVDAAYTYSRPHPVVETDPAGRLMLGADKQPVSLDLSDPFRAKQLNPGQKVVDAFQGFEPKLPETVTNMLMSLYQKSGMNPIAAGESPGSDPAGYTVNTLQGAALAHYETNLDNEAETAAEIIDFARKVIRDTIKERVFLTVPMEDRRKGGTEWLGIGPDDIDETPCVVTIDPLSDAQRLAIRQSLTQGWKDKLISRRRVQEVGYGVQDPTLEDDEILLEGALERLAAVAVDNALIRTQVPQPGGGGLVDQFGNPMPPGGPGGGMGPGALPAPPQPPTVGAQGAAASQQGGGGGMNPSRALAGQDRGYRAQGGTVAPTREPGL